MLLMFLKKCLFAFRPTTFGSVEMKPEEHRIAFYLKRIDVPYENKTKQLLKRPMRCQI